MTPIKYISILFIFLSTILVAQETNIQFNEEIQTLNDLGRKIIGSESDDQKREANEKYISILNEVLSKAESFDFNFSELKTISILQAHNLKIYNWAVPLTDGTFEYFAFLQLKTSKTTSKIVELKDKSNTLSNPENKVLTSRNWFGALYHELIYNKKLGKNYYTVLGWDGNNNLSNKKIIDIINISNKGITKFGAPVFKTKKRTKKRMIFEYAEDAIMSLKYYPNSEKIVFNQLDPISSNLKGVYEYYAPNLKYFDALFVKDRKWHIEKNTNITLDRSIKDKFWKDPEK